MDSINLASYTIKFKKSKKRPNEPEQYLNWDDLFELKNQTTFGDPEFSDAIGLLSNLKLKEIFPDERRNKSLMLEKVEKKENIFYGQVYYGKHGEMGKLVNLSSGEEESITENKSVMSLFYFLFYFHPNDDKGILILERKGNRGMKYIFEKWIKVKVFNRYRNNFQVEIKDMIPTPLMSEFITNGDIRAFEFEGNKSHLDSVNRLHTGFNEIKGSFDIKFNIDEPYQEKAKHILNNILSGEFFKQNFSDNFVEITNETEEHIKVNVNYKGKNRVFSLGSSDNFKPYFDITEDIDSIVGGVPDFEEMTEISVKYAEYLLGLRDDFYG